MAQYLPLGRIEPGDPDSEPLVAPSTVRQQNLTAGVGEGHQALPVIARIETARHIAARLQAVDDAGHRRRPDSLLRGQFTHQLVTGVEQHAHSRKLVGIEAHRFVLHLS
jgi:hypothetical protein